MQKYLQTLLKMHSKLYLPFSIQIRVGTLTLTLPEWIPMEDLQVTLQLSADVCARQPQNSMAQHKLILVKYRMDYSWINSNQAELQG